MSVTKPAAASLGGGGICLVRDFKSQKVELLDFTSQLAKGKENSGQVKVAIPANPFGFFALHTKYGVLNWERLIRPAENLARFGVKVSRVFSNDLHMAAPLLKKGQGARGIFFRKNGGKILKEGTPKALTRELGTAGITIQLGNTNDDLTSQLSGYTYTIEENRLHFTLKDPDIEMPRIIQRLTKASVHIQSIESTRSSLEDVFLSLTGKGING